MIFTVLLTPPNPRFRKRLATILRAVVHPATVVKLGGATYRFEVAAERVPEIREALRKDVKPWGAEVRERER